ncbi:hypothetical protein CLV28_2601 [Sediminihabitans luteus]|uniref:Putative membrane protein insertion efficiency factor n=1 Tax=Sediminihabitans luteus TaxID=1138585 RepID=A0A2M9CCQ6_9CELL|nr:membrane protein insertion efficiency factor YidD [Sediminihabitans luteus]PJJ69144.1 hypothetical protein CLV28_2601 [Sediminihabitans luteus]
MSSRHVDPDVDAGEPNETVRRRGPARRALAALGRAPRALLVLLVRGYQLVVSPWMPASCKYYPSCSQYAVIALERHGALRGTRLAVWRLLRCNPWSRGGVDDVPERAPRPDHAHHQHER